MINVRGEVQQAPKAQMWNHREEKRNFLAKLLGDCAESNRPDKAADAEQ